MATNAPRRYRRFFGFGEGNRVNRANPGTHEFNVSTEAPERPGFWRTGEFTWSAKGASRELWVKVRLTLGNSTRISDGRVWDRYRRDPATDQRRFTETRFRPMAAPVGRQFYAEVNIPDDAIIVVTKGLAPGIDYKYEVILPSDNRYPALRLPHGQHEAYY